MSNEVEIIDIGMINPKEGFLTMADGEWYQRRSGEWVKIINLADANEYIAKLTEKA